METTEPTEAAAVAEPLNPPDNSSAQASRPPEPPAASGPSNTAAAVNGTATGARPKSAAAATKRQPLSKTESASGSRPGATTQRAVSDVRPTNTVSLRTSSVTKTHAPSAKPTGDATVAKKTLGRASCGTSAAKTQVKMPDKKPTGQASAATTMTNGTKPANSTPKKTLAVKPRTTGPQSQPTGSTASKSGTSSSTKPNALGPVKSSRPATAPTSHLAAKASTAAATTKSLSTAKTAASRAATAPTAAATTKPPSTAKTAASRAVTATTKSLSTAKTAPSRAATAPPSGRTAATQPNKAIAPGKKDVRPPPAAVPKKTATTSVATKKPEASKSTVNLKSSTASAKTDAKSPPNPQSSKPNAVKKPAAAAARFPAVNRVGQTPPGSPVSKCPSVTNATRSKQAHRPNQPVSSLTPGKKTEKMGASKAAASASTKADATPGEEVLVSVAPSTAAAIVQGQQAEAVPSLPQGLKEEATEAIKEFEVAQSTLSEISQKQTESNTISSPQSPVRLAFSPIEQQQLSAPPVPTEPALGEPLISPVDLPPETFLTETQMSHSPKPAAVAENGSSQEIPLNLNEDDEEEEKEGSQQVSVSEMSGTTQPTEESRPGSAGPVGASAWRVGGALLSELDSEEVSVSQQGASELSAPGVLEGTESMDDLGEGSLKGAMDMEGASAGSPDFEKVPEIPVNDYDDDDEDDDNDRVCDMDVGSERTDEPQRLRHDNDVEDEEDEDEDVEMASEGVTESGLESYGNADEDDFAEDERLDNLNRVAQPPPPPLLPSAPAAQWDQPNPFTDPWAEPNLQQQPPEQDYILGQGAEATDDSPLTDPCQADSETPTQEPAQTWFELGSATLINENQTSSGKKDEQITEPQMYLEHPSAAAEPTPSSSSPCAPMTAPFSIISSGTSSPDKINYSHSEKDVLAPQSEPAPGGEAEGLPVDDVLASANAPASNPSSSSVTEDEASDMEGEAQLEDSLETTVICDITFENKAHGPRCLSTVEEGEEPEDICAAEDATPPSATSQVSYGFDTMTSASNSNAQSTGESCVKSPGIFSLEELSEEAKEPPAQPSLPEQPYIECGKGEADCQQATDYNMANSDKLFSPSEPQQLEQMPPHDDIQTPYYSAICEKTENSFTGFSSLLHPQRRDHSSYPRTYCDIVKPVNAALASPKLTCADLPPRSPKQQPLSPQLRRLEQHQRHLLELQQRREQQSRPLEEAEQERKRREEEEERKKKDEAEEEIKRNKEEQEKRLREEEEDAKRQELEQRKALELQLHQQQEELKQRQQIMQWQQELQESNKGQPLLLSPSSGLCTIYESLENSDEEDGVAKCEEEMVKELNPVPEIGSGTSLEVDDGCERVTPESQSTHNSQDIQQRLTPPPQNGDSSSTPSESPDRPSPLDLDWGKKVDIVHQLINQTLLLNGDGCSSLLLLPGGAGGTLSPLESSLWPSLLPPLTPPSATVTSVSSFSPETSGSSPQGEWTVVELETHH